MPLLRRLLLTAQPAGTLHSLDELFALADAMEKEAANRYAELADEMLRQNKPDLAAVFTQLAAEERKHVDSVTRWSQSRIGKVPDPALVRWSGPEAFDREMETEIRTSRLMTPYRALSMAVQNEERAFAFWSYLAAFSDDAEIKKAAEAMASEELGHVAALRKERRRAYHREHDRTQVPSQSGRQVDAGILERCLVTYLTEVERRLEGASVNRAREFLQETTEMSAWADGFGRFPATLEQADAQTIAEALTDAYLEGAERVADQARLEILQELAARAIARLAWMRSLI